MQSDGPIALGAELLLGSVVLGAELVVIQLV